MAYDLKPLVKKLLHKLLPQSQSQATLSKGNRHSKHVEMGRLVTEERAALSVSYRDVLLAPPPKPDWSI